MKTEFDKNNYIVIKKAVEPKIAEFVYNYFLMKRQVAKTMFSEKYISPFTEDWGVWNDNQVPGTYIVILESKTVRKSFKVIRE